MTKCVGGNHICEMNYVIFTKDENYLKNILNSKLQLFAPTVEKNC